VEKTYVAEVESEPGEDALQRLRDGVELDDGPTAPAQARRLGPGRVELVLHEGRKHQVKRMLAAVDCPVTGLHRSAYAGLTLAGLEPGACRELTRSEVEGLREASAPERGHGRVR
jgi:pseudouridine synthase